MKEPDEEGPKDANEALTLGLNLMGYLERAKKYEHKNLIRFPALESVILHNLQNPDEQMGIPFKTMPTLSDILMVRYSSCIPSECASISSIFFCQEESPM